MALVTCHQWPSLFYADFCSNKNRIKHIPPGWLHCNTAHQAIVRSMTATSPRKNGAVGLVIASQPDSLTDVERAGSHTLR